MKLLFKIVLGAIAIWLLFGLLSRDTYVGFYYPDDSNLFEDIQSDAEFKSLDECRDWVDSRVQIYNPDGYGYDYECGKNCDLSGGKPYVCEETLE